MEYDHEIVGESRPLSGFFPTHADFFMGIGSESPRTTMFNSVLFSKVNKTHVE